MIKRTYIIKMFCCFFSSFWGLNVSSHSWASTCHYDLLGDVDGNCRFDIVDFSILTGTWLVDCNSIPLDPSCNPLDIDGDGFNVSLDCNDDDPNTYPGAVELCGDSVDNDCDDLIDEFCDLKNNGEVCTIDDECISGYCRNGYCCDTGDCCALAADCPPLYYSAPSCDTASICQGSRTDATCVDFICNSQIVDDDSACDGSTMALACNPYADVYCTGMVDQSAPVCPVSCVSDTECANGYYCDVVSNACVLKLFNGQ